MRIAYLIQSHRSPSQIARLTRTLLRLDPDCVVHISHDRRKPRLHDAAFSDDRVRVSYDSGGRGRFHGVGRWLSAVHWLEENTPPDYVLTISGQDYPLVSGDQIKGSLAEAGEGHDGCMEHFPVFAEDSKWPAHEGKTRYRFRWHEGPGLSPVGKRRMQPLHGLNHVQPVVRFNVAYDRLRLGVRTRRLPRGITCYGGSFFTNLSWPCVEYVLDVVRARPDVRRWAQGSLLIEEAFLQSLLLSAGRFSFANDSKRFYDFESSAMGSPAFLTSSDVPRALASEKFFGRKFDLDLDPAALDSIDESLFR